MPRNSSGTYTLPEAAFQPSTPISSSAVNSDFSDIGDALTDSLSRSGDGGMQAALPLNVAGFFYQGDTDTGMSRPSANTQKITCGGTDVVEVTASGASVTGTLDADTITQGGVALGIIPIGLISPYGPASAPAKWLLCDGTSYLRATYPALFAAIGTTYGAVDGTHFSVPDLRGRAPVMADGATGRLPGFNIGVSGGEDRHTLNLGEIPTGITSVNASQAISVSSSANVIQNAVIISYVNAGGGGTFVLNASPTNTTLTSTGNNSISVTSNNTSGGSHNNVQPTIAVNYIIYAGA